MTRRKVNLRILIGLPASGKSTFAQDFAKDKYERVETFGEVEAQQSCSFMGEKNQRCEPMKTKVLHKRLDERLYYRPSTLIVDGLFLTTDRVMDLIDFVSAATELQSITLD